MTSDQGGRQGEPTGRAEGASEPAAPQGWNAPPPPPTVVAPAARTTLASSESPAAVG